MDSYLIKSADHWQQAFYSSEHLAILKLSPTNNEELEKAIKNVRVGSDYQGGKIACIFQPGDKGYVDGEWHGLIAAKADLPGGEKYTWEAAKKACDDLDENGYSDWHLPSKEELHQLYLNRSAVGGFASGVYWSSTEFNANDAWLQNFDFGRQYNFNKTVEWRVRPVRAF
jgi:hypothetical protein